MMRVMRLRYLLFASLVVLINTNAKSQITPDKESRKQMAISNLSSIPLAFTKNQGQFGEGILFKANAGGATFCFYRNEVAYLFTRDIDELNQDNIRIRPEFESTSDQKSGPKYQKESMLIKAQFLGANSDPKVIGINRLPHNNNYFLGNDPSEWRSDVPNYSSIIYEDIYPGIDLKYYGDGKSMKYDFIVKPGADISQIQIRYDGVDDLGVTPAGDLQVNTRFGFFHASLRKAEKKPRLLAGVLHFSFVILQSFNNFSIGPVDFCIFILQHLGQVSTVTQVYH